MEVSGKQSGKGVVDHTKLFCDPCTIDSVHEDAINYCIDCNEFLCENCTNNHKKSKASRKHKILDKDSMPSERIESFYVKCCPKHNAEMLNYFCNHHNGFCCSVCVTLDHLNCPPVQYINEIAESEEYKGLLQHINDIETELIDNVIMSKQTNDKVCQIFDQLQASLIIFRAEIDVKLDALVKRILSEAQQIKDDDLNALEFKQSLLEITLNDLRAISSNLNKFEKYQQHRHLFNSAKQAQTKVKEYKDELDECLHMDIGLREYTFKPNEDIKTFLNSSKLGTLEIMRIVKTTLEEEKQAKIGAVIKASKMTSKENNSIQDAKVHAFNEEVSTLESPERSPEVSLNQSDKDTKLRFDTGPTTVYAKYLSETEPPVEMATNWKCNSNTAIFIKQINMKHESDKALNHLMTTECSITGIEVLDINTLAVADHENKSIKIVDLEIEKVSHCFKLNDQPFDLSSINQTRIVTVCDTALIFLQFEPGELSIEKKLPIEPGCRGIDYLKNKLFLTFAGKQPCVEVLDLDGNTLQVFAYDADGHTLFSDPRYIAVSTDGQKVFISDRDLHSVATLDMKGNLIHTYKHNNLKCPTGLIQDKYGNILVAGSSTKTIHRISQENLPIQSVLDTIECPQAVAYSGTDNLLYITRWSYSFIYVFKLDKFNSL